MKKVLKAIKACGFKPIGVPHKNANGPDLWALKGKIAFSFEVKKARITKRNSVQVPPVSRARRQDSFIAIEHPSGYVLIEPMDQNLKLCTPKGYRTLWA